MRKYQGSTNASASPCPLALPLDCQVEQSDESAPDWHRCQGQALCFGTGVFSLGSLGTHLSIEKKAMTEMLGEKASASEGTGTQGKQLGPESILPTLGVMLRDPHLPWLLYSSLCKVDSSNQFTCSGTDFQESKTKGNGKWLRVEFSTRLSPARPSRCVLLFAICITGE